MRTTGRFEGFRASNAFMLCAVVMLSLSSCSLFRSRAPGVVKKPTPAPQEFVEPAKPNLPYCKIDLGCPLSSVCSPKLYVLKSNRRLLVVNDGVLVRDYLVGLGDAPTGDKKYIGDGRTPEGEFFICVKNSASKFYKSLGLNYPTPKRAEDALLSGLITLNEYRSIVQANENKYLPPFGTKLGGAIFIHGGGGYEDWTKGCIAVGNSVMDELFEIVSVGTPVEVLP